MEISLCSKIKPRWILGVSLVPNTLLGKYYRSKIVLKKWKFNSKRKVCKTFFARKSYQNFCNWWKKNQKFFLEWMDISISINIIWAYIYIYIYERENFHLPVFFSLAYHVISIFSINFISLPSITKVRIIQNLSTKSLILWNDTYNLRTTNKRYVVRQTNFLS